MPPPRRAAIFLQDLTLQHQYIRSRQTSSIVERPERMRAVNLGLSAAMARLEGILSTAAISTSKEEPEVETDDLVAALGRMDLATEPPKSSDSPIAIVTNSTSIDLLNHPAVKFVHGDIDGDVYLENLKTWAKQCQEKISMGVSEIPEGLPQGDLYLCPTSVDAMQGAIGTVCEAVDTVIASTRPPSPDHLKSTADPRVVAEHAFVSVRPPGHHCGEDTPNGFCFLNNVAVGAAHAHLAHGIKRVIILDIDLHHGQGTQSIAWQINEETYRRTLDSETRSETGSPSELGLQIFYGSIHDVLSYPCEDGKPELVQAASVSIHGPHGQYVENIHLRAYTSEDDFWNVLYKEQYNKVLQKAADFIQDTDGSGDDVLVFISCGFDACEHEYPSMSRHNRRVPTSFFYRFAQDACAFADKYARGRLVSVLEGGYSDRALTSGAMAHLCGLADADTFSGKIDESWWSIDNLIKLEKAIKKRRGKQSLSAAESIEPWLQRAVAIFSSLDGGSAKYMTPSSSRSSIPLPPSLMTLRERKKPSQSAEPSPSASPSPDSTKSKGAGHSRAPNDLGKQARLPGGLAEDVFEESNSSDLSSTETSPSVVPKKLPRVILRLGPPPGPPSVP